MAFLTYPFNPLDFVDKINSFYNNGRKFKSELSFSFEGVFGSPPVGPITLNYDPVNKHFFGSEVYDNPYYVGPPDNLTYTRTCRITQISYTEWYMEYNDDGPDGIFFYGRKEIDPPLEGSEGFYAPFGGEWQNYNWATYQVIEGGTITISDIRKTALIDPSLFLKTYVLSVIDSEFGCFMTPILSPWYLESLVNEGRTPFYYNGDRVDSIPSMKTELFNGCFPTHYGRIETDNDVYIFFIVWGKDPAHIGLEPSWRIVAYSIDPPDGFLFDKPIMSPHSGGSLYYDGMRSLDDTNPLNEGHWRSNNSDRFNIKLNNIDGFYSDLGLLLKVELRS